MQTDVSPRLLARALVNPSEARRVQRRLRKYLSAAERRELRRILAIEKEGKR